jgi:hypothetical protein|nr:MAG TPA: Protein of unknown function (DUF1523) [Caudoviricetes sp.]
MKNYLVHYGYRNTIISTSRNAAKHLQNLGGDRMLIIALLLLPVLVVIRTAKRYK